MGESLYLLNHALTGIGRGNVYPQHQQMNSDYDFGASNSIRKLKRNFFPDFKPEFGEIELQPKTVATDLISSGPIPSFILIVSPKLMKVLAGCKLPEFQQYSLKIKHKDQQLDYLGLHILYNDEIRSFIDYGASEFGLINYMNNEWIADLKISSTAELESALTQVSERNKTEELNLKVWAKKLALSSKITEQYDLFQFGRIVFPYNYVVTQNFKDLIEAAGCTGIEFQSASDPNGNKDYFGHETHTVYSLT